MLAVIALALGVGLANTAIFSLINDLFLRALPFHEPQRVVHVYGNTKDGSLPEIGISAPRFMQWRQGQTMFSGLAAENGTAMTLTGLGEPAQLFRLSRDGKLFRCARRSPDYGPQFFA